MYAGCAVLGASHSLLAWPVGLSVLQLACLPCTLVVSKYARAGALALAPCEGLSACRHVQHCFAVIALCTVLWDMCSFQ